MYEPNIMASKIYNTIKITNPLPLEVVPTFCVVVVLQELLHDILSPP